MQYFPPPSGFTLVKVANVNYLEVERAAPLGSQAAVQYLSRLGFWNAGRYTGALAIFHVNDGAYLEVALDCARKYCWVHDMEVAA